MVQGCSFLWFSVDFRTGHKGTSPQPVSCLSSVALTHDFRWTDFFLNAVFEMSFLHACFFYNTQHILCGVECVRVVFSWLYWESPIKSVIFSYFHNRKTNCRLLLPSIIRHHVLTFNSVAHVSQFKPHCVHSRRPWLISPLSHSLRSVGSWLSLRSICVFCNDVHSTLSNCIRKTGECALGDSWWLNSQLSPCFQCFH